MSIILGLNCYHADSSACIIINDKLTYGIEEERINRTKWSISNGEIHVFRSGYIQVYRINPDKSITKIEYIRDEKGVTFVRKEGQATYKKVKE
mgnify:CR=1 FL=1